MKNAKGVLGAINCQTKTLAAAKASGNDVIVQVKEKQKTLLRDCKTTAETMSPDDVYQEPVIKARNRIESRKVEVLMLEAERRDLVLYRHDCCERQCFLPRHQKPLGYRESKPPRA